MKFILLTVAMILALIVFGCMWAYVAAGAIRDRVADEHENIDRM